MQRLIASRELGARLIDVMGLPSRVTEIDISLRAGALVTLTVKRMMGADEASGLVHELSRYGLVEMEPYDSINRTAGKALADIEAKYQASLDWLDAKHASNCYALSEGCC